MRQPHRIPFLVAALLYGTAAWAQSPDPNSAANALLVETVRLVDQARTAPDLSDAATRYRQVDANIRKIVDAYPGSDLAVKIITGQPLGRLNVAALKAEAAEVECLASGQQACLVTMAENAIMSSPMDRRSSALQRLAEAQMERGDREGARRTLLKSASEARRGEDRIKELYISFVAKALTAVDIKEALEIAKSLQDTDIREQALLAVAKAQATAGDRDAARATLRGVAAKSRWYRTTTLSRRAVVEHLLGDGAAASKSIEAALKATEGNQMTRSSDLMYVAESLKAMGRDREARDICARATRQAASATMPDLRAVELAEVARRATEIGFPDQADAAILRIRAEIDGAKPGNKAAETLLASARARLVSLLADRGDIEGAKKVLAGLNDRSIREMAVVDVSVAQAKAGELTAALAALDGMPDNLDRSRAMSLIAGDLAEKGKNGAALRMAREISDAAWRGMTYAAILRAGRT